MRAGFRTGLLLLLGLLATSSLWAKESSSELASEPAVDRIEVLGVTLFPDEPIEDALEVAPGEALNKLAILRSTENLISLYRVHGYERAEVKTKIYTRKIKNAPAERVLEFNVDEGLPTRVAAINFVVENTQGAIFDKIWLKLRGEMGKRLGVASGEIFDQEKISQGRRAIADVLAGEEFIGAKVDDIRVFSTEAPTASGAPPKAARWVSLEIHLDLGDRVRFGFRGNSFFTTAHLLSLVEEQRVLGFGKDYIGAIQNRIEEEYRANGFAKVRLSAFPIERPERQERHITYVIEEGDRVLIDSVDFDGNAVFSNAELRDIFFSKASTLVQHKYYVEKDIQKAVDLLIETLKSRGYLSAKSVTISHADLPKVNAASDPSLIKLMIYIYEGDKTVVNHIQFSGVRGMPEDRIKFILKIETGQPLNLYAFSSGLDALKKAYRDLGYLNMQISNESSDDVVTYEEDNRLANINLIIAEGDQYRVSRIETEGLVKTREAIVRRELLFSEGQILHEYQVIDTEARLRKLGIFSLVNIRVLDDGDRPGYKIVRVSLEEGTPGVVAGGVGFRNDLGPRVFGQTAYTNLWGQNHTVSLVASINRRIGDGVDNEYRFLEYQVQLGYVWPWFAGINELTFRPTLTGTGNEYIEFDARTVTAALTWEKPILKNPNLIGSFTYSLEYVDQFDAPPVNNLPSVDNATLRIGSITPALRLDLRDNPLAPTSGLYSTVSYEFASPWLYSQNGAGQTLGNPVTGPVGYSRILFRSDYFLPVTPDIVWFFSFRTGFERNNEVNGEIPLIEQFAIGGISSLRGYADQEINDQGEIIQGTLSFVNYRTQIDFPFTGALKIGPFLDAANLRVDSYSLGALLYGAGFGLHYQSPVGPINFDWGFKLNQPNPAPQPNSGPYNFYFSVGVI